MDVAKGRAVKTLVTKLRLGPRLHQNPLRALSPLQTLNLVI
ncbi:hypothetical protein CASFOL_027047 [Castilleja foliolosa]|uniref:Ribosomal protein L30 n=1 Tax=Castilleja foliolosa TaxID=1961234 RepID=A0ABD3CIT3_9LAMI